MTRLGKLLLLLACALLLGAGVLARSAGDAAAGAGTPGSACSSCCPDDCHCGDRGAACACDHRVPQAPLPAPEPRLPSAPATAPVLAPLPAAAAPKAAKGRATARMPVSFSPLPARSRQVVLSVWLC